MQVTILGGTVDIDCRLVDLDRSTLRQQIAEYETGDRRTFEGAVAVPDSFTGSVMDAMATIPYGETRTYGDLADELDTGARAVGGACGRNPVPLVVPCHRVVRADGGLGGYSATGGVTLKRRLLAHEASHG